MNIDQKTKSLSELYEMKDGKPIQSKLSTRYDLIPFEVLREIAKVLKDAADKYGDQNWQNISIDDHLNHAINHIVEFNLDEKPSEDHLIHAICRLMFARYLDEFPK